MICKNKSVCCLINVAGVVLAILAALYLFQEWFPYLFYLRVPLLSGALLFALPLVCLFVLPSMLGNLYVLSNKWHLAFVILMSVVGSLAVVIMGSVIAANSPLRFSLEPSSFWTALLAKGSVWGILLAVLLALPTSVFAFVLSRKEMGVHERNLGAMIGAAWAILVLALVNLLPANILSNWLDSSLAYLFSILPIAAERGYVAGGHLAEGHLAAASYFLVALGVYVLAFFLFRPNSDSARQRQAPALFYLLELIQVWSFIFSLLTFSLDYFRIPSVILFVAFSALIYRLCKVDHYYHLKAGQAQGSDEDVDSIRALHNRLGSQSKPEPTLVVVCASGGGIQAAGWTAKALTGLQEVCGEDFTRAIGLISSVSGGSVGALYFLDRFKNGCADPAQLDTIFDAATNDSLGATGWGLSYPDLWRFAGAPFLHTSPRDRGAAIDLRWKSAMENPGETIRSWGAKVVAGEMPIPVFNSTLVEDGRAFRLTPVNLDPASPSLVDFNQMFPNYDLDASTAALLSANFPYVTPITRNSNPGNNPDLPVYHVADGGFFDNFGVVAAVDWLDQVLALGKIKRVLFVEIQAFYQQAPSTITEASSRRIGWLIAVFGPLFALSNVRTSTQAQRNSEAVEELIAEWQEKGVAISRHVIGFPKTVKFFDYSLMEGEGKFTSMVRSLQETVMEEKVYTPPLSWKLTKEQKEAIQLAWGNIKDGPDVQGVKEAWESGH